MILKKQPLIFLSYAREDQQAVSELFYRLEAEGYKVWMDTVRIVGGEDWRRSISRGVREADFFIACLSSHSVRKRGFVQREMKHAIDTWTGKMPDDIYLIPLKLEPVEIPDSIADFQAVSLYEEDGWERLQQAIVEGLRRLDEPSSMPWGDGEITVESHSFFEPASDGYRYSLTVEYPQFQGVSDERSTEINHMLRGHAYAFLQNGRKLFHDQEQQPWTDSDGSIIEMAPGYYTVTYDLCLLSPELLSVRFNISNYGSGAAHSNEEALCVTFRLNPPMPIELGELFGWHDGYIEELSRLCVTDLQLQLDRFLSEVLADYPQESVANTGPDDWIEQGAGPQEENFAAYNLRPDGLMLTFAPYSVGPYSWGTRQVVIPFKDLRYLDPIGPVSTLLH